MALLLAKEQFARRQSCVSLWVVPAEVITATRCEDSDIFDRFCDRSYRESWGYRTPKTVRVTETGVVIDQEPER
jgi:phenylacetate-CoA oxygenase PaaH subunit